jgi:hypothetical protein
MEYAIAQICQDPAQFDAGFTVTLSGAGQWSNTASDPIAALRPKIRLLANQLGVDQEKLAIAVGPKVWEALSDHAKILARITGGSGSKDPAVVTCDALAALLRIKRVEVLAAQYPVTVDPFDPTATVFAFLWGDVAIIYLPIENPTFADPLWGAITRKEGYPYVDEYRDPTIDATIKVTRDNWGYTLRSNKRAFLFNAASGL